MKFEKSVTILYAADVARSLAYYMEKLEFDDKWEWDNPPTFGGVSKDGVEIFFSEKGQGHPGTWLCIILDNVDEYYERIRAKGATIVMPPQSQEWNMREMFVQDPDGHIIRFGHRIDSEADCPDPA